MAGTPFLETVARELFEQEWERDSKELGGSCVMTAETCPIVWLIPELVEMMEQAYHDQIEAMAPVARQMLVEQYFVDEAGDCVLEQETQRLIERQLTVMTKVLKEVRQMAKARGQWSDVPVTPQMFG